MKKAPLIQNDDDIFVLTEIALSKLKVLAQESIYNRARINVHHDSVAKVQEMIIALTQNCIFQPHRHNNKSESFHIIEGEMFILIFNDDGTLEEKILLSANEPSDIHVKRGRYYRLDSSYWHSVLPVTELVVFHETTTGPFIPNEAELAEFISGDPEIIKRFYIDALKNYERKCNEI